MRLINLYQRCISSQMPPCCRFWPSCSDYAKEALSKYGFLRGNIKAAKRILRCHPFSRHYGWDPVE